MASAWERGEAKGDLSVPVQCPGVTSKAQLRGEARPGRSSHTLVQVTTSCVSSQEQNLCPEDADIFLGSLIVFIFFFLRCCLVQVGFFN